MLMALFKVTGHWSLYSLPHASQYSVLEKIVKAGQRRSYRMVFSSQRRAEAR